MKGDDSLLETGVEVKTRLGGVYLEDAVAEGRNVRLSSAFGRPALFSPCGEAERVFCVGGVEKMLPGAKGMFLFSYICPR